MIHPVRDIPFADKTDEEREMWHRRYDWDSHIHLLPLSTGRFAVLAVGCTPYAIADTLEEAATVRPPKTAHRLERKPRPTIDLKDLGL